MTYALYQRSGRPLRADVVAVIPSSPAVYVDPTSLPVANKQAPNGTAYNALNVPAKPAGFSYADPTTGVMIWKATSSTVPASNTGAGHDYADGAHQVSRGWGPNNNTHTLLIRGDGMSYYLVDFTRGVGFSNYRLLTVQPRMDLAATFSSVAGQERILYIMTNSQLVRYNTATMATQNTGFFPLTQALQTWLQQDKNDVWFVGLVNATTAFAWNSQTNQFLTHSETWLNEPRLERDGRYVVLTSGTGTVRVWDLSTNTFGTVQTISSFFHNADLRSHWLHTDSNLAAPYGQIRQTVSGGSLAAPPTTIILQSGGAGFHHAGNWLQSDAELNGDLNRQWSFVSGFNYNNPSWESTLLWQESIGVERSDGSDQRILCHHYSPQIPLVYFSLPFAMPSPDGKVVIFNSNMNGSGRYDLFVAEMPLAVSRWPNKPGNLTLLTDWALDKTIPTSGDVAIPSSPGWKVVFNSPPGNAQGWAELITDAGAPVSPSSVYDFVYPQGMDQGHAPATVYYPTINAQELYIGFWWKCSNPFDLGGAGNKICFEFYTAGNSYMVYNSPVNRRIDVVTSGSDRWTPNVDGSPIAFGVWHQVEWYMNRATNAIRVWVDGILRTSNDTVVYPSTAFTQFEFSPTWGGVSLQKIETDHYWFDHVHISGR